MIRHYNFHLNTQNDLLFVQNDKSEGSPFLKGQSVLSMDDAFSGIPRY